MDLKNRLALYNARKKYENFHGIKSFRIVLNGELTKKETDVIESIKKIDSQCNDKIPLDSNRSNMIDWIKQKVLCYLNYNSEIIIDGIGGAAIYFEDIEAFLQHYFEEKQNFDIMILNKDLKKCIVIFEEEYFLEFFDRDI